MVAAAVEETETTAAPGPTPNNRPAVMVSGTAGSASTSNTVYTPPYATYLRAAPRASAGLATSSLHSWQPLHPPSARKSQAAHVHMVRRGPLLLSLAHQAFNELLIHPYSLVLLATALLWEVPGSRSQLRSHMNARREYF